MMKIGNFVIKKLKIKTLLQAEKYAYEMFTVCNDSALMIYYLKLKDDINKMPTESKFMVFETLKKVMAERGLIYE